MSQGIFQTPNPTNEPVRPYDSASKDRALLVKSLSDLKESPTEIPVVIGGKRFFETPTEVRVPHDRKTVIARCASASKEMVNEALVVSRKAHASWSALPWQERAGVLLRAAELLSSKYRPLMNAATMLGQSKTVHQAEIDAACELIDFFRFNARFAEQIHQLQPESSPGVWNRMEARALEGFVYAISPFNFTSIGVNLASAPALMGCVVQWKPAPTSVLGAWVGYQILEEAGLPPGVVNFLPGDPVAVSQVLLEQPDLAGIHFTGSTKTFNHLWKEVASRIDTYNTYPRIVGETGGKDFVFAHESANVDELVTALVRGAFEYQGQKCSAASRAYIPKSLWPQVRDKLVSQTSELKMGSVEDFSNFLGAVIDETAYRKITGYIDRARQARVAKILAGGEYDDKIGYFVRPTVIEATDPNYETMTEEIFGPVLTVYPYEDIDQALELCDNSTRYALTGAIFAKDRNVIDELTRRLRYAAGNFYINDKPTGAVVGQQPFGGARASGTNDKAGSMMNLLRWSSARTLKENLQSITDYRYPYMD